MSRFTKGPWVVDKTSRSIGPVSKEDDQSYGMVLPVAWVEFDPEVETQAANQQLIAAAPELLEALQLFTSKTEHGFVMNQSDIDKCKAAIAKALGQ